MTLESLNKQSIQDELSQMSSTENQLHGLGIMLAINLAAFLTYYTGPMAIEELSNWLSQM